MEMFCPYMATERLLAEHELEPPFALGALVMSLTEQYRDVHDPVLRADCLKNGRLAAAQPTLLEAIVPMIEEQHRRALDEVMRALDYEPLDVVQTAKQGAKALGMLSQLLHEALEDVRSDVDSIGKPRLDPADDLDESDDSDDTFDNRLN